MNINTHVIEMFIIKSKDLEIYVEHNLFVLKKHPKSDFNKIIQDSKIRFFFFFLNKKLKYY